MDEMSVHIETLPNPTALARHVAEWMTSAALAAKGVFWVALSGGSTPKARYKLLASGAFIHRVPWDRITWYWSDERFVPYDHPQSNYRMAVRRCWPRRLSPPRTFIRCRSMALLRAPPRFTGGSSKRPMARRYSTRQGRCSTSLCGARRGWSCCVAAARQPVLQERKRWVAAVAHGRPEVAHQPDHPAIESSRQVAFLVTGKEKAAIFKAIRAGSSQVPAARIKPVGELIWFVDRAAAGQG
jgi:6-phosphogluconolactonase